MYNTWTNVTSFVTGITLSATPSIIKIISKGSKVLALINTYVVILSYNATSLTLLANKTLASTTNFSSIDVSPDQKYYLVANTTNIVVYSLTKYSQMYSYTPALCPTISNAKFGFNGYVLYYCNSSVYQLDLRTSKVINQFAV